MGAMAAGTAHLLRDGSRMFSQQEIDNVLGQAQEAVDDLSRETAALIDQRPSDRQGPSVAEHARAPVKGEVDRVTRILRLKVPVVVRLASQTMRLNDVLKLAPGSILEFDRCVDDELDLQVNNRSIGKGVAVKIDERYGLRITYIGDIRQRIRMLGGQSS